MSVEVATQTGLPPLVPREVLFGNPERQGPALSPDGRYLSYLAPHEGVMNIHAGPVGEEARCLTFEEGRGIQMYWWAPDSKHLLYMKDAGGDENFHVFLLSVQGGDVRDVTPFEKVTARPAGSSRRHQDRILLGINRSNPAYHDVYRLSLDTGELEMAEENGGFMALVTDSELQVREASRMLPDGSVEVLVRDAPDSDWRTFQTVPFEDLGSGSGVPFGFSQDGRSLFGLSSVGANTSRLVRYGIESGRQTVLFEDPEYDVAAVSTSPITEEPDLVGVLRARLEWAALDPALEPALADLRAAHPGDFNIVTRTDDDSRWLVVFISDSGPAEYHVYDRATRTLKLLFKDRPELEEYTLAPREPFNFTARDGLTIHGYLSFPPRLERKNLPAVFWVHGGPWARDIWGFDRFAQLLANRGYVCVQVNYRGSTGYGKAFVNAADREWAGAMHDDLIDAVEHIVAQGWVDRSRIAITGGSYGGYATLVGMTFTPDVFCCGVDIVGPSNLNTLIRSFPPYWGPRLALWKRRCGDPDVEEDFLWSRSPLSRVADIKHPLLVVQGENDPRVTKLESDQIVEVMKERGIPHEYLLVADEGHGFARPENWIAFAALAERFIAEHMPGGRYQP